MEAVEAGSALEPERGTGRGRVPRVTAAAAALGAAAAALPVVYLVIRAGDRGWGRAFDAIASARTAELLVRTVGLAVGVTAIAIVLGVGLAWLTERTDLPGARAWAVVLALPLVIPSYVGAYVVLAAFGPRGILQGWLAPLGVERLPSPTGFAGSLIVLGLLTYPYVFLASRAGLRGLDPALEEASRGLGASRARTFRTVVLPQLRPAIAGGALLVCLYTLHDFGAVSLLRTDTFTRAIFVSYTGSFDRSRAAVLGLVLVALALVVLAAEARTRGRGVRYRTHTGSSRPAPRAPLGRWRWPAGAACGLLALLVIGVPAGVTAWWLARAVAAGAGVSVTFGSAANSLRVAAVAAGVAVAAAWPIAVMSVRHPGRLSRALERVSYLSFALPGLVIALALVFFGARYAPIVYQTTSMLVFAYGVLFLSHAIGPLRASLLQLPPAYEEAAASLGSRRPRTLRRIVAPLVSPGVLAALALVFLTTMKELPATLLLAPTGFSTLATDVWSATNAASFGSAALPALGLLVLSSVPLAVLLTRRGEVR